MRAALSATPAVLTVELPQAVIANGQRPPEPLTRDTAEHIGQALAEDLQRILGDAITQSGLIVNAALYDLTELLQPGLPMTEALLEVYRGSLRGGDFVAQRLALGTAAGRYPLPRIAPRRAPGAGPLLALPFALVAPGPTLDEARQLLEAHLLERGSPDLATDRAIRQSFGVDPVNLAYATFHDLSALLKVQLEHAGFGALWTLLEGALYRPDEAGAVDTPEGNCFIGMHGHVWTPHLTFDEWSQRHRASAPDGYADWCRVQRQYTAGLEAHGVGVTPTLPRDGVYGANAQAALAVAQQAALADTSRRRETIEGDAATPEASAITLTEQRLAAVGPIAYTVLAQHGDGGIAYLGNEYPLSPEAIPAIRAHWRERAAARGASYQLERPGEITCAGEPLRLMPWLEYQGEA